MTKAENVLFGRHQVFYIFCNDRQISHGIWRNVICSLE
ncbi:hypothetical protein KIS4809_4789 [Bacillus sp. ZZV12-4809]|nr:hypothetical protein KIS4809_4789 [Bacillus sp. ZZV12-4809]